MSLTNLNFQQFDDNLMVSGNLTMVSSNPKTTLDLTNRDTSKVYIFSSVELYREFQENVERYPNNNREVNILDYDGKQVTHMPTTRRKNRCGTIPITIKNTELFSSINIPQNHICSDAEYYVDMYSYKQFSECSSTRLMKNLVIQDIFGFANRYSSLNISILLANHVHDFIKKNFDVGQIPENINIIPISNIHIAGRIICEEIFGKIFSESNSNIQGELFFWSSHGVHMTPKFVTTNGHNVTLGIRTNCVHFSGVGSAEFIAVFKCPIELSAIKITLNNEVNSVFEGLTTSHSAHTYADISRLFHLVTTYQKFVEASKNYIPTNITRYLTEYHKDVFEVIFSVDNDNSVDMDTGDSPKESKEVYANMIQQNINDMKFKIKQLLLNSINHDYSSNPAKIRRVGGFGGPPLPTSALAHYHGQYGGMGACGITQLAYEPSINSVNSTLCASMMRGESGI